LSFLWVLLFDFRPTQTFPLAKVNLAQARPEFHSDSDALTNGCRGLGRSPQVTRIDMSNFERS
jgi:hypothetical protein